MGPWDLQCQFARKSSRMKVATMTSDINNVYPGFQRATPENQPTNEGPYQSELTDIRPLGIYQRSTPPNAVPHFGHNTDHILG